ncbi:PREDICTED: uncharacterized protein LOC109177022 [Ipomoea nil]|uniref:uncharacterized protein LOC109177022 n=1 Tax=Ipomoea nil TaxID=35883 RepID=UPI0009012E4B|nr:PREDICTED: uncharacterized protein LOC109177022 [Ipomoea nil]
MDLDDVVIAEQVMATHHLNANINIELDADFVINLAENIFNPNTVSREVEQDMLITKKSIQDFREVENDMPMLQSPIHKELSYQIKQLSFEVAFKSLNNDTDCHLATICLLSILSTYPWEAKFIIKFVKCVSELNQPSSLSPLQPLILATYWITRSCFAFTRRFFGVKSKTDIMEESTLIAKSKSILSSCYSLLEAKRTEKSYKALLHAFSHSLDNLEVLKLIFNVKDDKEWIFFDPWPVYRRLGVDTLKNKRVLLMILNFG